MVKRVLHPHDGKSLKTVLIYAVAVLILVLASLSWKALLIFQQSKYTGEHFTLVIAQKDIVKEILVVDPTDESLSVLRLTDNGLKLAELATKASIATDGHINIHDDASEVIKADVAQTLTGLGFRFAKLQTNTTIFDIGRLSLYAKNLPPNHKTIKEISSEQLTDRAQTEKTLAAFFSDNIIATENISIQIVNASGVSGMAQRLERVLLYKGANVVTVSTAQKHEQSSTISYFGTETYTLLKIKKLLGFPIHQIDKETIADIIIVLGKDSSTTEVF